MEDEYARLHQEEKERVANYTLRWQSHLDKIVKDKDTEREVQLDAQRQVFETKLAEEEIKVQEA